MLEDIEDEEEFEEMEGDLDWSESHGDSLTPSQHSQPGRSAMEEVSLIIQKICDYAKVLMFCLCVLYVIA